MKKASYGVLIALIGLTLTIVGSIKPDKYATAKESGYEIDATIVDVEHTEEYDPVSESYDDPAYIYYVDYEVDGKEYKHIKVPEKGQPEDGYGVGDTIKVVVDPESPDRLLTEGGFVATVGVVVTVCGIISAIRSKRKKSKSGDTIVTQKGNDLIASTGFGITKKVSTFEEYINNISSEQRLKILSGLSNFGDSNEILNEILSIVPCINTNKREVRVNDNFFIWYEKETLSREAWVEIIKISSIACCYHNDSRLALIFESGDTLTFPDTPDSIAIFTQLQKNVFGFDSFAGTAYTDDKYYTSSHDNIAYFFNGNSLYGRKPMFRKGIVDSVVIENLQDIIWCKQTYSYSSDGPDDYKLEIYLANKQLSSVTLYSNSDFNAFVLATELKKRVPHLLYGPSDEYKEIFLRNPEELMAIAKDTMEKRSPRL